MNFHHTLVKFMVLLGLLLQGQAFANGQQAVYEKTTDKPLADILVDIDFALTEQNLRIVDRLHIGQTIRSRGTEDFPDYEVITYCSLTLAREMLELEPELINACPGRITVRQTGSAYIVAAPLWPEHYTDVTLKRLMQDMNAILIKIVNYAVEEWQ